MTVGGGGSAGTVTLGIGGAAGNDTGAGERSIGVLASGFGCGAGGAVLLGDGAAVDGDDALLDVGCDFSTAGRTRRITGGFFDPTGRSGTLGDSRAGNEVVTKCAATVRCRTAPSACCTGTGVAADIASASPANIWPVTNIAPAPNRLISCAENRIEKSAITIATGRKARPIAIGP